MNGCLRAVAILFGVVLLLPGACSAIFFFSMSPGEKLTNLEGPLLAVWLVSLILSAGGIFILVRSLRPPPGR